MKKYGIHGYTMVYLLASCSPTIFEQADRVHIGTGRVQVQQDTQDVVAGEAFSHVALLFVGDEAAICIKTHRVFLSYDYHDLNDD